MLGSISFNPCDDCVRLVLFSGLKMKTLGHWKGDRLALQDGNLKPGSFLHPQVSSRGSGSRSTSSLGICSLGVEQLCFLSTKIFLQIPLKLLLLQLKPSPFLSLCDWEQLVTLLLTMSGRQSSSRDVIALLQNQQSQRLEPFSFNPSITSLFLSLSFGDRAIA